LIDGLASQNPAGELVDGQIGTLPRSINREKTQRHHPHLVEVRKRRAEEFAGNFGRGIRADGLGKMKILREWNIPADSVNRRAGRKNETLDCGGAGCVEQMQRPIYIGIIIQLRLSNGRTHPGARRQMRDGIEFFPMKQAAHRIVIAQIHLKNRYLIFHSGDVATFDFRIIKIVEVIENGDAMPESE